MADNNISTMQLLVTSAAVTVSILSLRFAWLVHKRAKKSEAIKNLLSEKESVGFAAIKLLDENLPKRKQERQRIISAMMNACFFEGSDRARATLYHVIESNAKKYFDEFEKEFKRLETIVDSMEAYKFTEKELKLDNAVNRLAVLRK